MPPCELSDLGQPELLPGEIALGDLTQNSF